MRTIGKTLLTRVAFTLLALTLFVPALAQDTQEFDPADFGLFGDVEVGEAEPFEEEELDDLDDGAISVTATTPTDQTANINIVGPDGYLQHAETNEEGELLVENLLPGVYSVAATDDGLQLAEAKVMVHLDQATPVSFNLTRLPAAPFDPADYQAFGNVEVGPYEEITGEVAADEGAIRVEADYEDMQFVITGPNGYSEEFQGNFVAEGVTPGVYSIAGTADGYEMVETKVEVQPERIVAIVPTLVVYDPQGLQAGQETEVERAQETEETEAAEVASFADFDTDADGVITEEEFDVGNDAFYEGRFDFDELDADDNGEITEEEWGAVQ